jgi:hypothetical protein
MTVLHQQIDPEVSSFADAQDDTEQPFKRLRTLDIHYSSPKQ